MAGADLFYAAVLGCISTLGLPLNALALWILLRHHNLKSPSAVFMVNLAISDLLLVITLPLRVYFYATGEWDLGNTACLLSTTVFRSNIRSSSIFITFISVDRLLAVVYPLRSRHLRSPSNAVKGAVLVWLYVVAMSIPENLNYVKNLRNQSNTCFESTGNQTKHSLTSYITTSSIFLMLAVNIVCTAMVFWTLRNHISDSAKVKNKMNVMVLFVMNMIMFTICFLPLTLGLISVKIIQLRPVICLASANCCLDPLLYYFSLDAFWKKGEDVETTRGQKSNDSQL
ncbi:lysophosphatidic acid receptor 5b [Cololabis saira]|uniref:lysophosphatidic acid receptor 5b n=1 Tax=Cololabis saira TaxID=129043 RepID=UPI002AD49127|nr:lysophosphatidic acid receptor 5b [Cololabis saira]